MVPIPSCSIILGTPGGHSRFCFWCNSQLQSSGLKPCNWPVLKRGQLWWPLKKLPQFVLYNCQNHCDTPPILATKSHGSPQWQWHPPTPPSDYRGDGEVQPSWLRPSSSQMCRLTGRVYKRLHIGTQLVKELVQTVYTHPFWTQRESWRKGVKLGAGISYVNTSQHAAYQQPRRTHKRHLIYSHIVSQIRTLPGKWERRCSWINGRGDYWHIVNANILQKWAKWPNGFQKGGQFILRFLSGLTSAFVPRTL